MSEQRKSWVSRRVADLEARSTPKASSASTSPSTPPSSPPQSSSLKTKPAVFKREHRHPPPPNPSEKQTAAAVTAAPPVAARSGPGRDMTVEHRLADQADIMAKRITDLEAALAMSGRRIARLSSAATAAAATAPCHPRHADQAIAEVERCCATRVGQLEDALMQAEKRASWLQEELKVVWACGAQRVRELENAARQQEGGEIKQNALGRNSTEESGEGMDKVRPFLTFTVRSTAVPVGVWLTLQNYVGNCCCIDLQVCLFIPYILVYTPYGQAHLLHEYIDQIDLIPL